MITNNWVKKDTFSVCLCTLIGIVLAALPHLAMLFSTGSFEYLAEGDDVVYLSIAKAPYYGEWSLRDPFTRPSDSVPTLYSWLQFVPITKLASLICTCTLASLRWSIFRGIPLYII